MKQTLRLNNQQQLMKIDQNRRDNHQRLHRKQLHQRRKVFIFSKDLLSIKTTSILAATPAPNADADVETRLKVCVKNPEIILLEDQHNANSNCLVLDVSFSSFFFH